MKNTSLVSPTILFFSLCVCACVRAHFGKWIPRNKEAQNSISNMQTNIKPIKF